MVCCQGIAENFDPEVCNCEELARIVLDTLEKCEVYLQEAGPDHPMKIRLAAEKGAPLSVSIFCDDPM